MRTYISTLLFALLTLSLNAQSGTVNFVVIEDDVASVNVSINTEESGDHSYQLTNNMMLNVVVTPGEDGKVVSEVVDLGTNEVLTSSTQGGSYNFSGPNLYLLCGGKFVKRVAPAQHLNYSCKS